MEPEIRKQMLFLINLNTDVSYNQATPLLNSYPGEMKTHVPIKTYTNVVTALQGCQNLERTQMSPSRGTGKLWLHPHDRLLLSSKKE